MEKAIADLSGKVKTLNSPLAKTDKLIEESDQEALNRHKLSIDNSVSTVNNLKETIEEEKFAKGESEEQVQEWSTEVEKNLSLADRQISRIEKKLEEITAGEKDATNRLEFMKKLEYEKLLTKQKLQREQEAAEKLKRQEIGLRKGKDKAGSWNISKNYARPNNSPDHESTFSQGTVKMLKLVISKFQS